MLYYKYPLLLYFYLLPFFQNLKTGGNETMIKYETDNYTILIECNENSSYLLTREEASEFLGIDPKSFDKYFRSNTDLKFFLIGNQARYTKVSLIEFVERHSY